MKLGILITSGPTVLAAVSPHPGSKRRPPLAAHMPNMWPPAAPAASSSAPSFQRVWPPGGVLTFERAAAETVSTLPAAPLAQSPAAFSGGSADDGDGAVDQEYAAAVMARARLCMAPDHPIDLSEFASRHNLEAVLSSSLNAIAKAKPKQPLRALADLLPSDLRTPAPTLPSCAPEELRSLRHHWLTLHEWYSS